MDQVRLMLSLLHNLPCCRQYVQICFLGRDIESFGSVSALSFNADCTRLLCGHVRGHIVMYDVSNGKLLRILEDAHKEETTVINIKVCLITFISLLIIQIE